jgi:hypothetical protein
VPLHRIQKWLGHANISQTSTYLMAETSDDAEAMRRFEAHQAELQRIATEGEKGVHNRPPTAVTQDTEPRLSSTNLH